MKSIKYNKLIRDKMPQIIERSGNKVVIEKLRDTDFIFYLHSKLREEIIQYEDDNSVDKIADIIEVLYSILEYKGVSINQFEKIRLKKAQKIGSFKEKILLKEVIENQEGSILSDLNIV
ncbi:UNVERIFIED_CONTAM: putative house-cleaning noncanonical NTP pyrophosphatase (MazG superfamily) [Acetivibrio alkalicellulosi]